MSEKAKTPEGRLSRRALLKMTAGLTTGLVGASVLGCRPEEVVENNQASVVPLGGRLLLRGGTVITMDPGVGDFETGDVLIDGSTIAAVGPDLEASAEVIDASNMIVMPGFIDTHRHMWQGQLRNILPNGLLSDYGRDITGTARAVFRPEDAYIGDLVIALGAIHAGVTTVLDWSHIGNSPEHTDAAIEGLRESGIRGCVCLRWRDGRTREPVSRGYPPVARRTVLVK